MVDVDCRVAGASIPPPETRPASLRPKVRSATGHRDLASTGTAIGRSAFLRYRLGVGALALFGCGGSLADITSSTPGADTGAGGACSRIPEETAGPYPGDGSNGANVLNQTGVVRQDIRSSVAGLSGSATGVPLVIQLTLVSASTLAAHPGVQRRLRAGARDSDREHRVRAGCSVYCGRLSGGGWGQSQRLCPLALS